MSRKEFEIGDKVYNVEYGWGIIKKIDESPVYPILVKFYNEYVVYFTKDGKKYSGGNRALFFEKIPIPESALIKKRWRAKIYENFYFVNSVGDIETSRDCYSEMDDKFYNLGNYFETLEEAKESKFYKIFYKEV